MDHGRHGDDVLMLTWLQILTLGLFAAIMFKGTQILFVTGKIALDPRCCCVADCTNCAAGKGHVNHFEVTFAGIANSGCGSCGTYNTTFIVDGSGFPVACTATSGSFTDPCVGFGNVFNVQVWIHAVAGIYYARVTLTESYAGWHVIWEASLGTTKPDCTAFSSLNLPYVSGGLYHCNAAGATCSLTSVP